ncbi:phosphate ABC transporter permease subunit PstC, partial [Xanthomonas sp. Kuri4-3]
MNATVIPEAMPAPRGRDLRDARADRFFKLALTATIVLVLVALASAALSMLWGGRQALQLQG